MLMLSVEGWLNGLTAIGIFVFGWLMGIYFIYQSRKTKAKLLAYLSILLILIVTIFVGVFMDFLTILLTGTINYPLSYEDLRNFFIFILAAFISFLGSYIGTDLLAPKKKWYVLSLIIIIATVYSLFILFDPEGSITMVYPEIPGEDLSLAHLSTGSPAYILGLIMALSVLVFNESGFLIKALNSIGIIRKKFILLSIGFFFLSAMMLIEATISTIFILIFTRIIMIISFWIMYLGLREEPEKPQETITKEVRVEGGLIRLTKRPDHITEEEVTFHKEKKICLVCKGKLSRSLYLCPKCDALYCDNCAQALANLENVCWVCDEPLDEAKPTKVMELEEDDSIKIDKKD